MRGTLIHQAHFFHHIPHVDPGFAIAIFCHSIQWVLVQESNLFFMEDFLGYTNENEFCFNDKNKQKANTNTDKEEEIILKILKYRKYEVLHTSFLSATNILFSNFCCISCTIPWLQNLERIWHDKASLTL